MKALLFLSLVGLAIYAGLLYTHDALSGNTPEHLATSTENPNRPAAGQISSWASDLKSVRHRPVRVAAPEPAPRATLTPAAVDVAPPAVSHETAVAEPETVEPAAHKPAKRNHAKAPVQVSDEFITRSGIKRARMARRAERTERRRGFGLFRIGRARD